MTWRTHIAVGTNALWLAGLFGPIDQSILVLLPVAIIASILPDIDATSAKIHYIGGGALGLFRGAFYGKYFHHRGIMHSFPVALLFFIILMLVFWRSYPALPFVFAASYFSHSIIDGFNASVGYLYPFVHKRFALVPKSLRTPVGGIADAAFLFAGLFGILVFCYLFRTQLIPMNSPNF
jgi:membrane-bound metal-dependent hydrolase YbcI (DUF457 family)